jgi:hypothetical protein
MDQVRNFTQSNRSFIVNVIYIVAAIVLVYYLVNWYFSGEEKDIDVLKNKLSTTGANSALQKAVIVVKADDSKGRVTNEYTISAWIYVNEYASGDNVQGILAFFDSPVSGKSISANVYIGLHPTMPKMIVRAGNIKGVTQDPFTQFKYNISTSASAPPPGSSCKDSSTTTGTYQYAGDNELTLKSSDTDNKQCDVMDIDIQRWINVAVSVNGRIMDVYLDGKLARSCIMENVHEYKTTNAGPQVIMLCPSKTTYKGYISGVLFSNYAVTPDVIYARYQSGPYFSSSFLDYMVDKLGIRISYTDASGKTDGWSLADLGIKKSS